MRRHSWPSVAEIPVLRYIVLALVYRRFFGRWPNLIDPNRFSEKVQVAKLTWRSALMTRLADKVAVKAYVADRLGHHWVTPTLYSGPQLPPLAERRWPRPYIIKANNRSSANRFIHTERDENWPAIEQETRRWTSTPYTRGFQWAYRDIAPQILVEPFIGDGRGPLVDYKLFVFGGRVEVVQVDTGEPPHKTRAMYDRDWRSLPFSIKRPRNNLPIDRPKSLSAMIAAAQTLSAGFPFVRVDFYEIAGSPRFGEITFYPGGGWGRFSPDEYDLVLGKFWPAGVPKR